MRSRDAADAAGAAGAIPVIDLGAPEAGTRIDDAAREVGFFTLTNHGADLSLLASLDTAARRFFTRPEREKAAYTMALAGNAWRGWFPVGGELTAGVPDQKEGLYFGAEGDPGDPRPLHGPNQFPDGLREPVLAWMAAMADLAQHVLSLMASGLGLEGSWFRDTLTAEPVTLFRIFHYPPQPDGVDGWGVAEHTDYGLLTILAQDGSGGLEVRAADGRWVAVPPDPAALVCNLGDMLEKLTGGRYRSTPHRVRNRTGGGRLSFPFFLDPSWDATVPPLELGVEAGPPPARWDGTDPALFEGTYGEYLTAKVQRVFPDLWAGVGAATPETMEPS